MPEQPRQFVSEITEMSGGRWRSAIWCFFAAVAWGAVGGTLLLIGWGVVATEGSIRLAELTETFLVVGLAVLVVTLAGALVIGLPVTLLLKRYNAEREWLYIAFGASAGFVSMSIMFELHKRYYYELMIFPVVGAVAGAVAAWRWGRYRSALSRERRSEQRKRDNPIHDLVH